MLVTYMITYKQGDLLEATERIIVHGCNAQYVMGSGVALAIRDRWPEVFERYYDDKPLLGTCQFVAVKDKIIVNAITQHTYGRDSNRRYVSYDALDSCLAQLAEELDPMPIAMPKIGAGLGGGDWNVISSIIASRLRAFDVNVYYL